MPGGLREIILPDLLRVRISLVPELKLANGRFIARAFWIGEDRVNMIGGITYGGIRAGFDSDGYSS